MLFVIVLRDLVGMVHVLFDVLPLLRSGLYYMMMVIH